MFPKNILDTYNEQGFLVKDNSIFRRRFMMMLDIPTYEKFQKVMFYDVL